MSKAFHFWRLKLNFYATNYQNGISRKFFDQPRMMKMILRHTLIFSQNSWVTTLKMSSQNCMKHLRHFFDSPLLQPLTQKVGILIEEKFVNFQKRKVRPSNLSVTNSKCPRYWSIWELFWLFINTKIVYTRNCQTGDFLEVFRKMFNFYKLQMWNFCLCNNLFSCGLLGLKAHFKAFFVDLTYFFVQATLDIRSNCQIGKEVYHHAFCRETKMPLLSILYLSFANAARFFRWKTKKSCLPSPCRDIFEAWWSRVSGDWMTNHWPFI